MELSWGKTLRRRRLDAWVLTEGKIGESVIPGVHLNLSFCQIPLDSTNKTQSKYESKLLQALIRLVTHELCFPSFFTITSPVPRVHDTFSRPFHCLLLNPAYLFLNTFWVSTAPLTARRFLFRNLKLLWKIPSCVQHFKYFATVGGFSSEQRNLFELRLT